MKSYAFNSEHQGSLIFWQFIIINSGLINFFSLCNITESSSLGTSWWVAQRKLVCPQPQGTLRKDHYFEVVRQSLYELKGKLKHTVLLMQSIHTSILIHHCAQTFSLHPPCTTYRLRTEADKKTSLLQNPFSFWCFRYDQKDEVSPVVSQEKS